MYPTYPQYPQQPPPQAVYVYPAPQKRGLSTGSIVAIILGAVLLIIFVPVCLFCGGGALLFSNAYKAASTQIAEGTPTPQPPLPVGGIWTASGVSCTLVSDKVISGDSIVQPQAGDEFVVVRVTLSNQSSAVVDYSYADFHVLSSAGNITNAELLTPSTYTANKALISGSLVSGSTVTGDVILEAPKGDH